MVKTNKETMERRLLITKARTAPLMGLDRMQRLKINLSSNNDAIKIHNINLDATERKITKLQQALEPLIKRNRSNKTYCARLTSWLDRLAHFDINIKHIAGKHLALTDYLSRNLISSPEPIENYDEENGRY